MESYLGSAKGEKNLMGEFNVMSWSRYLLRVFTGVRPRAMWECLSQAREKSGKSRAVLFPDMLWCLMRYGAGYHDYLMFQFFNMDGAHRKTYVTRLKNKRLVTLMNDPAAAPAFDRKSLFYTKFREYLGRDFMVVPGAASGQLEQFAAGKEKLFAKPDVGESGKGIQLLNLADFASTHELLSYLKAHDFGVVEDPLEQHPDLARLYPHSANTLRIVTLLTGEPGQRQAQCVYAVIKTGCGGKFVDNLESGGLFCPIDQETGTICGPGHTSDLRVLDRHPDTGVELRGFAVPYVKEAIQLCQRAALVEPRMRYLGWDVCITPTGPVIVEGNDYPGYDFWQQPEHTPDRIGLWPYYKKVLPEL